VSWERGRAQIERLLNDGELERVPPSEQVAARLLTNAEAHIGLASKGIEDDPAGTLQLSYDAARKASVALLAVQGLRSTTRGHIAVIDATRAQFDDGGMKIFDKLNRLRRRRNTTEYPGLGSPTVTADDARKALATAREIVGAARNLIDGGRLDLFE
jgi:HEPN domain-containing protein